MENKIMKDLVSFLSLMFAFLACYASIVSDVWVEGFHSRFGLIKLEFGLQRTCGVSDLNACVGATTNHDEVQLLMVGSLLLYILTLTLFMIHVNSHCECRGYLKLVIKLLLVLIVMFQSYGLLLFMKEYKGYNFGGGYMLSCMSDMAAAVAFSFLLF